ncbi:phosphatase PAP2 family protein [Robertkochia sediminum]|uniref:phosphatase PAP2 family protein n=1 Tax=Robertkochia sediminum TaxID=2785326 RepID=UPI0019343538|nr:phosphatase PAP2 family protein [Robertkochia sediminum]MBL7472599.1 phosphatase PAP2 family protein [Robertkochia sediminum]
MYSHKKIIPLMVLFTLIASGLMAQINENASSFPTSPYTPDYALPTIPTYRIYNPNPHVVFSEITGDRPETMKNAQPQDSLSFEEWNRKNSRSSLIISGTMIATGAILISVNENFNNVRQRYQPNFEDPTDDYIQYAPIAAIYAMNALGYKGRHNIPRYTLNFATTGIVMLAGIQGLKSVIDITRPDDSSDNSWPSGHTATAFMAAHMLNKEYGYKNPYIPIAGYTIATTVGAMRQLNNRHWFSDTVAGAGFGIGLTELGYYLSDLIFKDYGVNEMEIKVKEPNYEKPSFFGSKLGYAKLLSELSGPAKQIFGDDGFQINVDGHYMFNPYVGVAASLQFASFPLKEEATVPYPTTNIESNAIGVSTLAAGPSFGYPFSESLLLQGKVLFGYARSTEASFIIDTETQTDLLYADVEEGSDFSIIGGLMLTKIINKRMGLGLFTEYTKTNPKADITILDDIPENGEASYTTQKAPLNFEYLSFGISFNVMLW